MIKSRYTRATSPNWANIHFLMLLNVKPLGIPRNGYHYRKNTLILEQRQLSAHTYTYTLRRSCCENTLNLSHFVYFCWRPGYGHDLHHSVSFYHIVIGNHSSLWFSFENLIRLGLSMCCWSCYHLKTTKSKIVCLLRRKFMENIRQPASQLQAYTEKAKKRWEKKTTRWGREALKYRRYKRLKYPFWAT